MVLKFDVMSRSECFKSVHRLHLSKQSFDGALDYGSNSDDPLLQVTAAYVMHIKLKKLV